MMDNSHFLCLETQEISWTDIIDGTYNEEGCENVLLTLEGI